MMELTPLDVRKKKGDFRRGLRGYEPTVVDDFLDLVAERLESLVREAAGLKEKVARLEQQVTDYRDREKALTEALVTAQEMREEIRSQSAREVDLLRRQAEQEAESIKANAVRAREREEESLSTLRNKQLQFLASYRSYLEQELADLAAHARAIEMKTGGPPRTDTKPAPSAKPAPPSGPVAREEPGTPRPGAGPAEPAEPADRPEARAGAAVGLTAGPARGRSPSPGAERAPDDPVEAEIDAQVGAALDGWTTEFDEESASAAPDLILSDADVVDDDSGMFVDDTVAAMEAGPGAETGGKPAAPTYDESAFRADVSAAFGDSGEDPDKLLDLESFDSLRGGPDPALGESIVGPPPVVPPDELTISPVFLERATPDQEEEGDEVREEEEKKARPDMFSSLFEDDG